MLGENLDPTIDSLRTRVQLSDATSHNTRVAHRSVPINVQLIIRPSNSSQRSEAPFAVTAKIFRRVGVV